MSNKFEFPKRIKDIINRPLPPEIIQERAAGKGSTLSYVSGAFVVDTLNLAFGEAGWEWNETDHWIQQSQPKFNQYAKEPAEKLITIGGKQGIMEDQAPVCHVCGKLTVRYVADNGEVITKQSTGFGSKSIVGGQSDQEHIFKSASTDAMKKAASHLGIAGELYRKEEEQKYYDVLSFSARWSDDDKAKFGPHIDYIASIMSYYGFSNTTFAPYVQAYDSSLAGLSDINADNIEAFNDYLQKTFAGGEE